MVVGDGIEKAGVIFWHGVHYRKTEILWKCFLKSNLIITRKNFNTSKGFDNNTFKRYCGQSIHWSYQKQLAQFAVEVCCCKLDFN